MVVHGIDCVVAEVNIALTKLIGIGGVWLSSEANQPIAVQVDSQGLPARHQNIDPKVDFERIDQQGVVDISLNDISLIAPVQESKNKA